MRFASPRRFSKASLAILLFSYFVIPTAEGNAEVTREKNQKALTKLGRINTYSPLEAAYSHGSLGFSFGLGYESDTFDDRALNSWGNHTFQSEPFLAQGDMVNAYLTKGFQLPIDFGVSTGQIPGTTVQKVGGHLQWTFFEGFRLPSFATRVAFSRLSGYKGSEIASSQVSLLTDYSFLRYFTIYLGYNVLIHHASYLETKVPDGLPINKTKLQTEFTSKREKSNWADQVQTAGIKLKIWPPFFILTTEFQKFATGEQKWVGKASFGL